MTSEYTGIEIGRHVIRIASVEAERNGSRIVDTASCALDAPFSSDIIEKKIIGLLPEINSAKGPAVISISPAFCAFRRIELPFSSDSKISQVIDSEIETLIPFQPERIKTSFTRIESGPGGKSSSLLVCAVDGEEMESIISAVDKTGFEVVGLTVSGYASAAFGSSSGWPDFSGSPEDAVYADLGDDCITFSIIRSGEIVFIRPVAVRQQGTGRDSLPDPAWIFDEALRTIIYYSDYHDPCFSASAFFLLISWLKLGNVQGNDWQEKMDGLCRSKEMSFSIIGPEQPEFFNILSSVSLYASGKRFLNFVESGFLRAGLIKDLRKNWAGSMVMAACSFLFAFVYLCSSEYVSLKTMRRLDSDIRRVFTETFPETKKVVDPYQQMSVKVKSLMQSSGKGPEKEYAIDILKEISLRIKPEADLTVTGLTILPDEIKINGESQSFDIVENARKMLSESELFKDVKVDSVSSDSKSGKVIFKLHLGRRGE